MEKANELPPRAVRYEAHAAIAPEAISHLAAQLDDPVIKKWLLVPLGFFSVALIIYFLVRRVCGHKAQRIPIPKRLRKYTPGAEKTD